MSGWIITSRSVAEGNKSVLHDQDWLKVLSSGFRCSRLYAFQPETAHQVVIDVIHRGPFSIGFINFPGRLDLPMDAIEALVESVRRWQGRKPDLLRVATNSQTPPSTPGTWPLKMQTAANINSLAHWNANDSKRRRKDLKAAERGGLKVRPANTDDGSTIYRLYNATILRHGGVQRYTPDYFKALVRSAHIRGPLAAWVAYDPMSKAPIQSVGFCVAAANSVDAYYLHAGFDSAFRNRGVSDLLLLEAVQWAKHRKANCFDLLSSPLEQIGLMRFKEKWAGPSFPVFTYDFALHPVRARLLKAAMLARSLIPFPQSPRSSDNEISRSLPTKPIG